ncbi:MAG: trypsin-like serine protease, partial [Bdellovibrionales bacterium]|nr:trypsin-like serine protease [Bdellovibrionales bacterium]
DNFNVPPPPARALDIALIFLDGDLDTLTLSLETNGDTFGEGDKVIFAGYGLPEDEFSPFELNVSVNRISSKRRDEIFISTLKKHPIFGQICSGDSGGPLLHFDGENWTIIGVASSVSGTTGCSEHSKPNSVAKMYWSDLTIARARSFLSEYGF